MPQIDTAYGLLAQTFAERTTQDTPNGPVRFPGPPAWFSGTPGRVAGPAPRLGAHMAEIMNELDDSSPT
ncbi:MAG TPA: hypothetical protein VFV73_27580 [Streptosporangiaceae bacterium]|nr:hypothetical protein [Streptosporangiaceae bacterium]